MPCQQSINEGGIYYILKFDSLSSSFINKCKRKRIIVEYGTNPYASSSTTVVPMQVAPPSTRAETTGDVWEAASCVLAHSGCPNVVTCPSMSNLVTIMKKNIFIAKQKKWRPQHCKSKTHKNGTRSIFFFLKKLTSNHKIHNCNSNTIINPISAREIDGVKGLKCSLQKKKQKNQFYVQEKQNKSTPVAENSKYPLIKTTKRNKL